MNRPRGAHREEHKEVIELINHVFRVNRGHEPTMEDEFPLLLNPENSYNMRIIKKDDKVVSTVNFMTHNLIIGDSKVPYGAIGGVCTHEDYSKKGLSSLILTDVERRMDELGVALCLISGTRSLYTRRDAMILKSFKRYDIKPKQGQLPFQLVDYTEEHLEAMMALYEQKTVRYQRSLEEFAKVIVSAPHDWGDFTYKKLVLFSGDILIGYVVLRIVDQGKDKYGELVEVRGSPEDILKSVESLTHKFALTHTKYYVHVRDRHNQLDQWVTPELDYQQGTIKIINFTRLMMSLEGYFYSKLDKLQMEKLAIYQDKGYGVRFGDEAIYTDELSMITKLIFDVDGMDYFDFRQRPKLQEVLATIFPLPMPWTKNLNYQ